MHLNLKIYIKEPTTESEIKFSPITELEPTITNIIYIEFYK